MVGDLGNCRQCANELLRHEIDEVERTRFPLKSDSPALGSRTVSASMNDSEERSRPGCPSQQKKTDGGQSGKRLCDASSIREVTIHAQLRPDSPETSPLESAIVPAKPCQCPKSSRLSRRSRQTSRLESVGTIAVTRTRRRGQSHRDKISDTGGAVADVSCTRFGLGTGRRSQFQCRRRRGWLGARPSDRPVPQLGKQIVSGRPHPLQLAWPRRAWIPPAMLRQSRYCHQFGPAF